MSSLWTLFQSHEGRPVRKWAHYFPAYEQHLARFIDRPVVLLEIGVSTGGSLQMWKRWLGPRAVIVGIDIDPACKRVAEDQVHVRIGDQTDTVFLDAVLAEFGSPDVVIDDGSHVMSHVTATFEHLYPLTLPSGVYLVEDMHTAYWPSHGGGVGVEGSFIETAKRLVDELNADWTDGVLAPTRFTRSTTSMHFYDSMVVFERGAHPPATPLRAGRRRQWRRSARVVRAAPPSEEPPQRGDGDHDPGGPEDSPTTDTETRTDG